MKKLIIEGIQWSKTIDTFTNQHLKHDLRRKSFQFNSEKLFWRKFETLRPLLLETIPKSMIQDACGPLNCYSFAWLTSYKSILEICETRNLNVK